MNLSLPELSIGSWRAVAAAVLLAANTYGENPLIEAEARVVYATQSEMTSVFTDAGLPDLNKPLLSKQEAARILQSLKRQKLTIVSRPQAVIVSGRSAVVTAGRELRFPTEFVTTPKLRDDVETAGMFPSEFEVRTLGAELRFTGTALPGGAIDLAISAAVTKFLGFIDDPAEPGEAETLGEILERQPKAGGPWQPVFSSYRNDSTFRLPNGTTAFFGGPMTIEELNTNEAIGIPKPRGPDQFVFFFVTAKTIAQTENPIP